MNINNAIARAQKLMFDENWNRQVEIAGEAQRGKSITGRGGGNDLAALEAQAFGRSASAPQQQYAPITEDVLRRADKSFRPLTDDGKPIQILSEQYVPPTQSNSRLPKSVLKSFEETPPLSGDDGYSEVPASYFGAPQQQYTPQPQYVPQQQYAPQPQYVPQPQYAGAIDYNVIKQIVKEAISEGGSGLLTEGSASLRGMRIANGSVIQFIDTKGNLYEGVLKLKKKAQK